MAPSDAADSLPQLLANLLPPSQGGKHKLVCFQNCFCKGNGKTPICNCPNHADRGELCAAGCLCRPSSGCPAPGQSRAPATTFLCCRGGTANLETKSASLREALELLIKMHFGGVFLAIFHLFFPIFCLFLLRDGLFFILARQCAPAGRCRVPPPAPLLRAEGQRLPARLAGTVCTGWLCPPGRGSRILSPGGPPEPFQQSPACPSL